MVHADAKVLTPESVGAPKMLGLSEEALAQRRKFICASDAIVLILGKWRDLYRQKVGLARDEDLSDELRVQMGLYTEPFNLAWAQRKIGREIHYFSGNPLLRECWRHLTGQAAIAEELQVSGEYPFMACNLDGMTTTARGAACPVDAKHVGLANDPMVLRYTAAGTHQATVMGCDYWALSVFVGNGKWEYIEQEVDPIFRAQLVSAEREFWGYVERGEEPEDRVLTPVPKPAPRYRTMIVPTDDDSPVMQAMCREENWLAPAIAEMRAFVGTDAAAKRNAIAREKLRDELIPADIGHLEFGRYTAKRSKAGALTMTVEKMEEANA